MHIVLVEDESATAAILESWLREADHQSLVLETGGALTRILRQQDVDLIILDWLLPDMDGLELLRWIREQISWSLPVIFVTNKDTETDIVNALNAGADDYMVKPVQQGELLARINAATRRSSLGDNGQSLLRFGRYRIDIRTRAVFLDDEPVELTQKEFDLALFLFRGAGRLLSRGLILESVWGLSPQLNTRTVDTHMSRIRSKLRLRPENGWRLKAVYQHGYRLEPTGELRHD